MAILRAKVKEGWLVGMPAANQMFSVFRGVPFAEPPVGDLRWRDPKPMTPWEGDRTCYTFAPMAMQKSQESEGYALMFRGNTLICVGALLFFLAVKRWVPQNVKF